MKAEFPWTASEIETREYKFDGLKKALVKTGYRPSNLLFILIVSSLKNSQELSEI